MKGLGGYMKIFRQLIIIIGLYITGDVISKTFSLPIPGNILGMLILLFLLITKVIKLDDVEDTSNFLLSHLSFFFIPAGVGLISSFSIIKNSFLQIILICIVTTIITIGVTGKIVELLLNNKKKTKENNKQC